MVNRVNGQLLKFGHTFGVVSTLRDSFGRSIVEDLAAGRTPIHERVCPVPLPGAVRSFLGDQLEKYTRYSAEVTKYERLCLDEVRSLLWPCSGGELVPGSELLKLFQTVPGIGPLSALVWLLEIVDPTRFTHPKQVAAFAGCDPSLKVSAGKVTSSVRRKGNVHLHESLIQAAGGLIRRRKEPFGQWGYQISRKTQRGGFKKASGAVARRLAQALWYVHLRRVPFSYDGYAIAAEPDYPTISVEEMVPSFAARALRRAGYETSTQVVQGLTSGNLCNQPGVGPKCVRAISDWMQRHRARRTSSATPQ